MHCSRCVIWENLILSLDILGYTSVVEHFSFHWFLNSGNQWKPSKMSKNFKIQTSWDLCHFSQKPLWQTHYENLEIQWKLTVHKIIEITYIGEWNRKQCKYDPQCMKWGMARKGSGVGGFIYPGMHGPFGSVWHQFAFMVLWQFAKHYQMICASSQGI